ncbi:MAG: CoA-binding protein [Candidatus Aminicenantales bacterium]
MSYVTDILKEKKIFAVVGVSGNKEKYGYKIFKTLLAAGYKTYPINPKYESIDDHRCYKSLADLPDKPEVVVTVVPPAVTEKVVDSCLELGISTIWMPPGSWSDAAIKKCEENQVETVHDVCLILAIKSFQYQGSN